MICLSPFLRHFDTPLFPDAFHAADIFDARRHHFSDAALRLLLILCRRRRHAFDYFRHFDFDFSISAFSAARCLRRHAAIHFRFAVSRQILPIALCCRSSYFFHATLIFSPLMPASVFADFIFACPILRHDIFSPSAVLFVFHCFFRQFSIGQPIQIGRFVFTNAIFAIIFAIAAITGCRRHFLPPLSRRFFIHLHSPWKLRFLLAADFHFDSLHAGCFPSALFSPRLRAMPLPPLRFR